MVDKRVLYASRFLKPPGFFKRAELREKPHRKTGPFENPVRRFVRLREKARIFSEIPLPRRIPIPKPVVPSLVKPIEGVSNVSQIVLQRRLDFLLGDSAKQQQLHAKLREGLTPYLAELYMWERQMRDIRKIYRAQYLQKLAEVTIDERKKQYDLFIRQKKESYNRREEIRRSVQEENKRKAILRDTLRIEKRVTQALELGRLSEKKISNIYWLNKLQTGINFSDEKINIDEPINVPQLARELGNPVEEARSIKHKIKGGDLYFRHLLKESFELMPEDVNRYEDTTDDTDHSLKAKIAYSKMTESEKLSLLESKIKLLNEHIDNDSVNEGRSRNDLYVQLRDHLDAVRLAYMEKNNAGVGNK